MTIIYIFFYFTESIKLDFTKLNINSKGNCFVDFKFLFVNNLYKVNIILFELNRWMHLTKTRDPSSIGDSKCSSL